MVRRSPLPSSSSSHANAQSSSSQTKVNRVRQFRLLWLSLWSRYPVIFWSGLWALLVVLAAIAMSGLINPDLSQPQDPSSSNTTATDGSARESSPVASPVWLFGVLMATCGLGSYLLAKWLQAATPPALPTRSRSRKRSAVLVSRPNPDTSQATLRTGRQAIAPYQPPPSARALPPALPRASSVPPVLPPAHAQPPAPPTAPALPASSQAPFAIPQAQRLRDLDRRAPGLAELLEIQRRREVPGEMRRDRPSPPWETPRKS